MTIDSPHRRYNPLLDEWVLVSPHRGKRPWQGSIENDGASTAAQTYESDCYLCAGNTRVGGTINPSYSGTFVFDNDFPALLSGAVDDGPDGVSLVPGSDKFFRSEPVEGACRVICYSEDHSQTLATMTPARIVEVIDTWTAEYLALIQQYEWIQIFENKGEVMGCSSPHPHGQIWASGHLPTTPAKVGDSQRAYFQSRGSRLLLDYVEQEVQAEDRIVELNPDWVVLVPWWAVWPFQTMLLPRFPISDFEGLSIAQKDSLAGVIKNLNVRYDNLFKTSFPYSMGWYPSPGSARLGGYWQLHANFYPPLLRSASVKKFMVGYEMLSEAQRDITPEQAASRLRSQEPVHHHLEEQAY